MFCVACIFAYISIRLSTNALYTIYIIKFERFKIIENGLK
jgi:hypothetical protein